MPLALVISFETPHIGLKMNDSSKDSLITKYWKNFNVYKILIVLLCSIVIKLLE